jgi:hypothetical protein
LQTLPRSISIKEPSDAKILRFFLILFCLAVASAIPRPNELTKKFVGAWRLVSIEGNPPGRINVEVLLVRFHQIPFTCSYPAFQSHSTLVLVAYLIGFVVFAIYIPQIVQWSLVTRWGAVGFIPVVLLSLDGLRRFRKQILDMDKQLVFEEDSSSSI